MNASTHTGGLGRRTTADVMASVVVFLVALPLCVAIAEACGYPPEAGVITGVVGGVLVGFLAGSPLQVSGPAAGLIVLVQDFARDGGLAAVGLIVLIGGGIQILAAAARLGRWFRAVPPAVVLGMLAGIGAIILGKQFHALFDTKSPDSIIAAFAAAPRTVLGAFRQPGMSGPAAAGVVGVLTVVVMIAWKSLAPKKFQIVPAAVVAGLAGTALAGSAGWEVRKVHIAGLIGEILSVPDTPWERVFDSHIWTAAITLALIASAESLLCAAAVDSKHTGPRTHYDRELFAQGVGNIVCGAFGALPLTGVIVRSSANLDAGAKTRLSAIMHGVWLFLFVAFLDDVLAMVPLAALAGVLAYTGWKLLELPRAWVLARDPATRSEAWVYAVTVIGVVALNLLEGVLLGLTVAGILLLWRLSSLSVLRSDGANGRIDVHLAGRATFLRVPKLAAVLDKLPRERRLTIDTAKLTFADPAIRQLVGSFVAQYQANGGTVTVEGEGLAEDRSVPTSPDDVPTLTSARVP